jgi:O-antigen/teichoic acid export membrane protein
MFWITIAVIAVGVLGNWIIKVVYGDGSLPDVEEDEES